METQSGARTPLVDPFGRELEEWLRDAPATRAPYLADLVVPPVTGPVQRPDAATLTTPTAEPATDHSNERADAVAATTETAAEAFRRPRDRARHAACTPSFPEPPARLALRIDDLAIAVDRATGRPTIERIILLEDEVRRRDEDLARLAAWEATVADLDDPEVRAAREFARTVFADLLADAATEADRRDRAAARRAATGPVRTVDRSVQATETPARAVAVEAPAVAVAIEAPALVEPERAPEPVVDRDGPVRPALGLLAVTPVSANTRPTPLVQPATGPTVIDRQAFAAALTAHVGATASTPVVLPEAARPTDVQSAPEAAPQEQERPTGWWQRFVARVLRALGRA
ncbi:hypothetical protein [Curtobacterium luteum]|uniref:Uncharacterized protein n=1 Tax=Curtobacterium luteum TaxID=33881 RepID=A0A175RR54_9MICO|nr:hypothetical protein [Curtobacterium luteum]KTR05289.1 hypothetical protein NS184_10435 [Curtobacterium luteum]